MPDPASPGAASDNSGRDAAAKWKVDWKPVLLLGLLVVLLYHTIAFKLVSDWYDLPDFSHGFLIPFFAAFLIWDKREQLRSTPIKPSWAGISLVVLGPVYVAAWGSRCGSVLSAGLVCSARLGPRLDAAWERDVGPAEICDVRPAPGNSPPRHRLQPNHFSVAAVGINAGKQTSATCWRPSAANGQHYSVTGNGSGVAVACSGIRSLDESLHGCRDLRILSGRGNLATRRACPLQPADCGHGQRSANLLVRPMRTVLGSRQGNGSFMSFRLARIPGLTRLPLSLHLAMRALAGKGRPVA